MLNSSRTITHSGWALGNNEPFKLFYDPQDIDNAVSEDSLTKKYLFKTEKELDEYISMNELPIEIYTIYHVTLESHSLISEYIRDLPNY